MKQTKEVQASIVSELYALRAGLSVVSQYAEEIKEFNEQVDSENRRNRNIDAQISAVEHKLDNARKEREDIDGKIIECNNGISEGEQQYEKTKATKYHWNKGLFLLNPFLPLGVLFAVPGIIITAMGNIVTGCINLAFGLLLIVIFFIISMIILYGKKREFNQTKQKNTESIKRELSNLKSQRDKNIDRIEQLKIEIQEFETNKEKLSENKEIVLAESETKINELNVDIQTATQCAAVCSKALEDQFGKLLNPSDWHNTDLCIFYLQTGRADTLKECLQLADRQRQNDEIVGAINQASERISSDLRRGFITLGNTFVNCLDALSNQIDVLGNTLTNEHGETLQALKSIKDTNSELLSATQLGNALQEKANASSEELLNDYKYVQRQSGYSI